MDEQTQVLGQVKQRDHFIKTKEKQTEKVKHTKIKSPSYCSPHDVCVVMQVMIRVLKEKKGKLS